MLSFSLLHETNEARSQIHRLLYSTFYFRLCPCLPLVEPSYGWQLIVIRACFLPVSELIKFEFTILQASGTLALPISQSASLSRQKTGGQYIWRHRLSAHRSSGHTPPSQSVSPQQKSASRGASKRWPVSQENG